MPQIIQYLKNLKNKPVVIIILIVIILPIILTLTGTVNLRPFIAKLKNITQGPTKYFCPTEKVFCENGSDIIKDGQYLGFGAEVASGSAVLASFDGKLTPTRTTLNQENLVILYLDSKDSSKRAIYIFKGDSSVERDVRKSETIGKIRGKTDSFNTSLIFQVLPEKNSSSQIIKLTPKDFVTY